MYRQMFLIALCATLPLSILAQTPAPAPDTPATQTADANAALLDQAWQLYMHNAKDDALTICDQLVATPSPDGTNAHFLRGIILADTQRSAEAIQEFDIVLAGDPDNAEVCNAKAWVLATAKDDAVRNGQLAVTLASHAAKLTAHSDGAVLDTLAAAYAEVGDFEQAVLTQAKAIPLLTNSPAVDSAVQRLGDYRQGLPFRE